MVEGVSSPSSIAEVPVLRLAARGHHYLATVHSESLRRGYGFDRSKLSRAAPVPSIAVTDGQLQYEWRWLLGKLRKRNPHLYDRHLDVAVPTPHPLFHVTAGPVAAWEPMQESGT